MAYKGTLSTCICVQILSFCVQPFVRIIVHFVADERTNERTYTLLAYTLLRRNGVKVPIFALSSVLLNVWSIMKLLIPLNRTGRFFYIITNRNDGRWRLFAQLITRNVRSWWNKLKYGHSIILLFEKIMWKKYIYTYITETRNIVYLLFIKSCFFSTNFGVEITKWFGKIC